MVGQAGGSAGVGVYSSIRVTSANGTGLMPVPGLLGWCSWTSADSPESCSETILPSSPVSIRTLSPTLSSIYALSATAVILPPLKRHKALNCCAAPLAGQASKRMGFGRGPLRSMQRSETLH